MPVVERNLLQGALCQPWPPHEAVKGFFAQNHQANRVGLREAGIRLHSGQAGA